ncbi:MAG: glycosyltransferase [Calditrichaceae bacterium]|nr:glycosyltransferase [Calditrichaceae bacterium]
MNFSVIIPVFNREKIMHRSILSVINQSKSAGEIIVINDGSADQTKSELLKYQDKIRIVNQPNRGVSAARNAGIQLARYEWLAFLDSDDEWHQDKLLKAEAFHNKHPKYKIFQSDEIWIRNGRRVNPKRIHQKYDGWIYKQSLPLCIVSPSAVVIHKDVFEDVGLFDESFMVCEDYDLWLRVSRKYPVGFDSYQGIIKYGGHSDQLSRKYWGMDHYRIKAMEKQLNDPSLPDDLRKATLQEICFKLDILIRGYQKRNKSSVELQDKLKIYSAELC